MNSSAHLVSPDPLPDFLITAAKQVARDLGLFDNWLNNGPSSGEGGLYQMGLPEGITERLTGQEYGSRLMVYFIGRLEPDSLQALRCGRPEGRNAFNRSQRA
jgi:hypothetical protein